MPIDPRSLSSRELLRLYSQTLTVLRDREVIRTRNAPAGDLAEWLVARAYDGAVQPNSNKSFDVLTKDGRRLQVKCRVLKVPGTQIYSLFRTWDFDACVFILFDPDTYDVTRAVEVPAAGLPALSRHSKWVAGDRVQVRTDLLQVPGARDVSSELIAAQALLDHDAGATAE